MACQPGKVVETGPDDGGAAGKALYLSDVGEDAAGYSRAFESIRRTGADALLVLVTNVLARPAHRDRSRRPTPHSRNVRIGVDGT